MISLTFDWMIMLKLGISAGLGWLIGIERELKRKPLGLKTCSVIAISSCLITIVSIEAAKMYAEMRSQTVMDPMRLAAQIVSGIGFIGAGVIMRRGNDAISGLTTAAMIWGAAGIGIAVGAGFIVEATVGSLLVLAFVQVIPVATKWIGPKALKEKDVRLKLTIDAEENITVVLKMIEKCGVKVSEVRVKDLPDVERHSLELVGRVHEKTYVTDLYDNIHKIDHVIGVEIDGR